MGKKVSKKTEGRPEEKNSFVTKAGIQSTEQVTQCSKLLSSDIQVVNQKENDGLNGLDLEEELSPLSPTIVSDVSLSIGSTRVVNRHQKRIPEKCFGTRHVQALLWFTATIVVFGMRSSMSVAIVAMTDNESKQSSTPTFQWDSQTQSYVLSALLWGTIFAQIPMSLLVRNGSSHKFFNYSILLSSICSILTPILAVKLNWVAVFICRLIMGICQGFIISCIVTLLSEWIPPTERAFIGSFIMNSPQAGIVIFLAISGILADSSFGWPSIFYICGSAGILWSITFYWLGADSPSTHKSISPEEREYIKSKCGCSNNKIVNKNTKVPWRAMLTSVPVWALVCAKCCQMWNYYMLLSEMPNFMKSVLKFDIAESGTVSAIPYIVKWLLAFPIGLTSDFALRKGASINVVRKISNSIGLCGPAVALLILCLLGSTNQTISVTLLTFIVGLNSGITCGQEINSIDISPNFSGIIFTFANSIATIFGVLAPLTFGAIVTDFYNRDQWLIIFYISIVVNVIGNLIFVIFGECETQSWNDLKSPDLGHSEP